MVKTVLLTGGTVSIAASATTYLSLGNSGLVAHATETRRQVRFRQAGVLSNLYVHVSTNAATATSTIRTRKAAANGGQSVSITSTQTGVFQDTTNTDTVASGDLVNYQAVIGSGGAMVIQGIGVTFTPTTTSITYTPLVSVPTSPGLTTASVSRFNCLAGILSTAVGTESKGQSEMRIAGTLKNLYVFIHSNARTTTTTFRSRKNSANGNMVVSVTSGQTGAFEDTTNTDTVTVNDLVDTSITTSTGTQSISIEMIKVDFETSSGDSNIWMAGAGDGYSQAAATTNYIVPAGSLSQGTTESVKRLRAREAITFSKFGASVTDNTANFATTFRVRKNGANGNQTFSVSAGTSGFIEDTTNSDDLVATDDICYSVVGAAGTGTLFVRNMSIVTTFAPATVVASEVASKVLTNKFITKV